METVDCVVVGAGVVGLAVARALALAGREVIVLEAAEGDRHRDLVAQQRGDPRRHLLSRRQPDGAALRRRPAHALRLLRRARRAAPQLRQADRRDHATRRASGSRDQGARRGQRRRGHAPARARPRRVALEPNLACTAALLSPATGIIDSHAYMLALQGDAEAPARCSPSTARCVGGRVAGDGGRARGRRRRADDARAAGCWSMRPACTRRRWRGASPACRPEHDPDRVFRQGQLLHPGRPLAVLPPDLSGAGAGRPRRAPDRRSRRPGAVRARRRMGGRASTTRSIRAAPTASTPPCAATGRGCKDGALQPGYSGIRPKIVPPGAPAQDFVVQGPQTHGVAGLINLFGIESPGLTASLALADHVRDLVSGAANRLAA